MTTWCQEETDGLHRFLRYDNKTKLKVYDRLGTILTVYHVTYDSYVRIALILCVFRDFDDVTRIEFRFSKTRHYNYSRTDIAEV